MVDSSTRARMSSGPRLASRAERNRMTVPGAEAELPALGGVSPSAKRRSGTDRIAIVMVSLAVAVMPILVPTGPGNTAPVDVMIAVAIVAAAYWLSSSGMRIHVPYVWPVWLLAVAGIIASLLGPTPLHGTLAVVQDLFLLIWCAAIVNVCRTSSALSAVLGTWAWSAIGWSGVLLVQAARGSDLTRTALTFGNPNLAASYLLVSLMVVVACGRPRRRGLRVAACVLIVGAILATGSLAGLVGLVVAGLSLTLLTIVRRAGIVPAVGAALCLVIAVGLVAGWMARTNVLGEAASSPNVLIRHSVGRADESSQHRDSLYQEEFGLFWNGSIWGIGPGATEELLGQGQSTQTKEAHNDYIAVLVERGVLGAVGLVVLFGALFMRAKPISTERLDAGFAAVVPVPAAIPAALLALAATAMFHEVLHFRHVWALFGIVGALYLWGRRDDRAPARVAS